MRIQLSFTLLNEGTNLIVPLSNLAYLQRVQSSCCGTDRVVSPMLRFNTPYTSYTEMNSHAQLARGIMINAPRLTNGTVHITYCALNDCPLSHVTTVYGASGSVGLAGAARPLA